MSRILILFGMLVMATSPASGQELTPDDFARGITVELAGDGPIYGIELPPSVYATVTREDLGDLRVFNADGTTLPHALDRPNRLAREALAEREVAMYPIRTRAGVSLAQVTIDVSRLEQSTHVRVDDARESSGALQLKSYLLDIGELEGEMRSLHLEWADTSDFMTHVWVEASEDLRSWERWGSPATVTQLRHEGQVLRRSEIDLPGQKPRYARLRWMEDDPPFRLTSVRAGTGTTVERDVAWARLQPAGSGRNDYRYDQAGLRPVQYVRLAFDEPGALARVEVFSATSPDGPWQIRYSGTAYRLLMDGQELTATPAPIPRTSDRYWRVVSDRATDLSANAPQLEIGWIADRVLFVPGGAGPYTLTFGAAGVAPERLERTALFAHLPDDDGREARVGDVMLSDAYDLGGSDRLVPSRRETWRGWLLWAALIIGVGALATMSIRLLKELGRSSTAAGTP